MSEKFPELYIGTGTVLNTDDLKRAFDAGAKFAVASGFNPTIVKSAIENSYSFAAVGGTWLGKPTDIVEEKWDAIREKVRQAVFNSRK